MSLGKTREGETGADTWRESPFDGGARDCSDAAASQGVPRSAVSPQEPEEASKVSARAFRGSVVPVTH